MNLYVFLMHQMLHGVIFISLSTFYVSKNHKKYVLERSDVTIQNW